MGGKGSSEAWGVLREMDGTTSAVPGDGRVFEYSSRLYKIVYHTHHTESRWWGLLEIIFTLDESMQCQQ